MAHEPVELMARVKVRNASGLHVRPCDRILKVMRGVDCELLLVKVGEDGQALDAEGRIADARRAISLLLLEAAQGTELELRARGTDAQKVIAEMVRLFESQFDMEAAEG